MSDKTPTQQQPPFPGQQGEGDDKQPVTTRDSIRAAIQEHKEKAADETKEIKTKEEIAPEIKSPEVKDEHKVEEKKTDDKKVEPSDSENKLDSSEKKEETTEQKVAGEKGKIRAPFGVDKELRAVWDDLPEVAQQKLSKLTKESLDRKADEGRRAPFREVEQVLTPLMPELQQAGVTPAQYVKRLVDYTYALANPNHQYKAIAMLARDYGIDLSLFGGKESERKDPVSAELPADNIPPELNQKLDTILNRFSQLETTQKSENEKAAAAQINDWAGINPTTGECTKKPFYPYVRQSMYSLIASGTVPLRDGKIDLDGAYEAACYAHPEIRDYMEEERTREAAAKVEAERIKQEKTRQQQLDRAKNAGSSLRPGAPVTRSPIPTPKNNSKGQPMSVRDSLRHAIDVMRSGQ